LFPTPNFIISFVFITTALVLSIFAFTTTQNGAAKKETNVWGSSWSEMKHFPEAQKERK
jgi:hypothetical protein